MTEIGYHASHEQFQPGALLESVRRAESRGFDAVPASDHFHPWSERQGSAGFAWSWLWSAMEATREQVRENVHVSADLDEHTERARSLCDLDAEAVYLHDVTRDQTRFVDRFGDHVLPALP
nr:hypothetical protein [Halosimplex aquaticum]